MQKREIQVGAEYAVALSAGTDLTSGIRGYAGRLAHARIVETDHEYEGEETTPWSRETRTVKKRGYLVEIVERFEGAAWGAREAPVWEVGDREIVDTGRDIVAPWAMYERDLALHRAAAATASAARERSHARWDAISAELARRGLEVEDPRELGGYSREIEEVDVPLAVLEALLGLDEPEPVASRSVASEEE